MIESSLYSSATPHAPTGRDVMVRLTALLESERGCKLTNRQASRIIGRPLSSTSHLLSISRLSQIQSLVLLLERLSDDAQLRFLRKVCRSFPTVSHARLAHSPRVTKVLLDITTKPKGLTLIRGNSEPARSFVLAAIAHTFHQLSHHKEAVAGIDIHFPRNVVPVEGVLLTGFNFLVHREC